MIIAIAVAAANWFILTMGILTFIPLALRTPLEEQRLLETFGEEYQAYMQTTNRYFPKIRS
jgi:protein-S-isoprenylcysteine O-methyltransferase Ste14